MNVLININKRMTNDFIRGRFLSNLIWDVDSRNPFLSIPFDLLRIKVLFITMVSPYLKLESLFPFHG